MVLVVEGTHRPLDNAALCSMFEARKRVFVDLLKWDVPVLDGRYEVDEFDDEHAVYLILAGEQGEHIGSARLLDTCRPHILGTIFPELCAETPPHGPDILEISRFCLSPDRPACERRETRNRLVTALAHFALARGVTAYTGVADLRWLQQILAFGWRCRPLGVPRAFEGKMIGALRIDVCPETPALLARNGIYTPVTLDLAPELQAA